jgi:hypothetical protein
MRQSGKSRNGSMAATRNMTATATKKRRRWRKNKEYLSTPTMECWGASIRLNGRRVKISLSSTLFLKWNYHPSKDSVSVPSPSKQGSGEGEMNCPAR